MGMDYTHSGSTNYPRFDREVCAVAEVFGGKKSENLKKRENTENERPFGYWFGFLSSDDSDLPKFIFPEGTNDILVKWFNDIYGEFTIEETKTIWKEISKHPEIKDISEQIWHELECDVEIFEEAWEICK